MSAISSTDCAAGCKVNIMTQGTSFGRIIDISGGTKLSADMARDFGQFPEGISHG